MTRPNVLTDPHTLNSIEQAKQIAFLRERYDKVDTEEGKAEILSELEYRFHGAWASKVDDLYHAREDRLERIKLWKEREIPLITREIEHDQAKLKAINDLLRLLYGMNCLNEDSELEGENYSIKLWESDRLKITLLTPIEEWTEEHRQEFAMVEEVNSTTVLVKNDKPIGLPSLTTKRKFILDRDAIAKCYKENPWKLPAGVSVTKVFNIKPKRKLRGKS